MKIVCVYEIAVRSTVGRTTTKIICMKMMYSDARIAHLRIGTKKNVFFQLILYVFVS